MMLVAIAVFFTVAIVATVIILSRRPTTAQDFASLRTAVGAQPAGNTAGSFYRPLSGGGFATESWDNRQPQVGGQNGRGGIVIINNPPGGQPQLPPPGVPPAPASPVIAQAGIGQPVTITAPTVVPAGTITVLVQYAFDAVAYGGAAQATTPGGTFSVPGVVAAGRRVRTRAAVVTAGGQSPWSAEFDYPVI